MFDWWEIIFWISLGLGGVLIVGAVGLWIVLRCTEWPDDPPPSWAEDHHGRD